MQDADKAKSKRKTKTKFVESSEEVLEQQIDYDYHERSKKYYKNSYKKYNDYFLKCINEIEDLQPSGFACIQISRYFTVGVLPKYCSIPDPLTRKQRQRVEKLLAE